MCERKCDCAALLIETNSHEEHCNIYRDPERELDEAIAEINRLKRENLNDVQARVRLARKVERQEEMLNSRDEAIEQLRQTIDDQADEIAKCKILKYEEVLDDMEEFCSVRVGGEYDRTTCGWRNAIYRMREIRNG